MDVLLVGLDVPGSSPQGFAMEEDSLDDDGGDGCERQAIGQRERAR